MRVPLDPQENVLQLNAPFKQRELERQFEPIKHGGCQHYVGQVTYHVDEKLAEVTCSACEAKLNPMWVLAQLCLQESRYKRFRDDYQSEMKRLRERSRTKCEHCRQMTRISHT